MATIAELKSKASQVRRDIVRMVHAQSSGHPGGSLGCTEIFVSLFDEVMDHDTSFNMDAKGEDMFFLSNGHISPVYYSTLARAGYFPIDELNTFRTIDSRLQGHPATHEGLEGIRVATGSLGQGVSVAIGAAMAKKMNGDDKTVYALTGDGELQEGQIWEAVMYAAHNKIDNLIVAVDYNQIQIDGRTTEVMDADLPWGPKFEAFGWNVIDCKDGNDFEQVLAAYKQAQSNRGSGKPTVIIMHTIIGKGVDFMEDSNAWHGNAPSDEQLATALAQLEEISKKPHDETTLKDNYNTNLINNVINTYTSIFGNDVNDVGKVLNKVSPILEGGMLSTLTGNETTDSEKLNGIIKNETEYITTWLLIKLFDNTINMSVFTDDLYSELVLDDKLKLTKQDMVNTMNRTELRMVNYVSEVLDINELDRLFYNTNDDVVFLNEEDEMSLYSSIASIVDKIGIHIDDCCNKVEEKRDQFVELNTKETIAKNPDLQNILDKQFNLSNLVCYSNDNVSKTNAVILLFLYLRYNISNTTELNLLNELYLVDLDILDTINYVSVNITKKSIIRSIKTTLLYNDKTSK